MSSADFPAGRRGATAGAGSGFNEGGEAALALTAGDSDRVRAGIEGDDSLASSPEPLAAVAAAPL